MGAASGYVFEDNIRTYFKVVDCELDYAFQFLPLCNTRTFNITRATDLGAPYTSVWVYG